MNQALYYNRWYYSVNNYMLNPKTGDMRQIP